MTAHPFVAALVHLVDKHAPHRCLAAIVTAVPEGYGWLVDVTVFDRGLDFRRAVSFEETGAVPGTWHWPDADDEEETP